MPQATELKPWKRLPYFHHAFQADHMRTFADRLTAWLRDEFQLSIRNVSLIGTGLSGTLALGQLQLLTGAPIAIVRKYDDSTHSTGQIEGHVMPYWVFVDDFIDSGETLRKVMRMVWEVAGPERLYLGSALYERTFEKQFNTPYSDSWQTGAIWSILQSMGYDPQEMGYRS